MISFSVVLVCAQELVLVVAGGAQGHSAAPTLDACGIVSGSSRMG